MEYKYLTEEEFEKMKNNEFNMKNTKHIFFPQCFYSNDRRKQKRCINKYVRELNKYMEKDFLWRGRFFVRQVMSPKYFPFEDKSGTEVYIVLRFYDVGTLKYIDCFGSVSDFCHYNGYRLLEVMNRVITEKFEVYHCGDIAVNPYDDRIDYNSVSRDYVVNNSTMLYPIHNYVSWY